MLFLIVEIHGVLNCCYKVATLILNWNNFSKKKYVIDIFVSLIQVWEKAGANGLLGVNTPEKFGGIGGDVLSTAITWEEQ